MLWMILVHSRSPCCTAFGRPRRSEPVTTAPVDITPIMRPDLSKLWVSSSRVPYLALLTCCRIPIAHRKPPWTAPVEAESAHSMHTAVSVRVNASSSCHQWIFSPWLNFRIQSCFCPWQYVSRCSLSLTTQLEQQRYNHVSTKHPLHASVATSESVLSCLRRWRLPNLFPFKRATGRLRWRYVSCPQATQSWRQPTKATRERRNRVYPSQHASADFTNPWSSDTISVSKIRSSSKAVMLLPLSNKSGFSRSIQSTSSAANAAVTGPSEIFRTPTASIQHPSPSSNASLVGINSASNLRSTRSRRGAVQLSPDWAHEVCGSDTHNAESPTRLQASLNMLKRISSGLRSLLSQKGPKRGGRSETWGYFG